MNQHLFSIVHQLEIAYRDGVGGTPPVQRSGAKEQLICPGVMIICPRIEESIRLAPTII